MRQRLNFRMACAWGVAHAALILCMACSTDLGSQPAVSSAAAPRSVAPAPRVEEFVLGPGDTFNVKVWRNSDLDRALQVDPAGNVDFPLVGSIRAEGQTLEGFKKELTTRLSVTHLVNPQVDVTVDQVRSRKVHVLGEVRTPGSFVLEPRATMWEAIAYAGGLTPDANRHKVLLIRAREGRAVAAVVDLGRTLTKEQASMSLSLKDRDLVYVLPQRIASVERFMVRLSNILSPILGAESAIVLGDDVKRVLSGGDSNTGVVVPR